MKYFMEVNTHKKRSKHYLHIVLLFNLYFFSFFSLIMEIIETIQWNLQKRVDTNHNKEH